VTRIAPSVSWDVRALAWNVSVPRGRVFGMTVDTVRLMLTARRHVDYGRVRSAMCPAC